MIFNLIHRCEVLSNYKVINSKTNKTLLKTLSRKHVRTFFVLRGETIIEKINFLFETNEHTSNF